MPNQDMRSNYNNNMLVCYHITKKPLHNMRCCCVFIVTNYLIYNNLWYLWENQLIADLFIYVINRYIYLNSFKYLNVCRDYFYLSFCMFAWFSNRQKLIDL